MTPSMEVNECVNKGEDRDCLTLLDELLNKIGKLVY